MSRKFDFDPDWRRYVSMSERRRRAARQIARLEKAGRKISPVEIAGRKITTTFWGDAWSQNLESYSDFANRLPRGRTYLRNGSLVDLQIVSARTVVETRGRVVRCELAGVDRNGVATYHVALEFLELFPLDAAAPPE